MRPPFRREVSHHLVRCVVSSDTRNQAFRGLIPDFGAKGGTVFLSDFRKGRI